MVNSRSLRPSLFVGVGGMSILFAGIATSQPILQATGLTFAFTPLYLFSADLIHVILRNDAGLPLRNRLIMVGLAALPSLVAVMLVVVFMYRMSSNS
jgi:hypothetical protein